MKRDSNESRAEKKIMAYLVAKSKTSPARYGPKAAADIKVKFSTGTVWNVQVSGRRDDAVGKVCQKNSSIEWSCARRVPRRCEDERGTARDIALPPSGTHVTALVTPRGIEYRSAKTGRRLTPPGSKK